MNTVITLILAVGAGNPAKAPLHCPAPVAAKGQINGGPPLAHTFDLTHTATGTLTITKVEAGCGCLRQTLSANAMQPGETAKLTIEVNTLTQPDGPNRWQVVVGYRLESPGGVPQTGEVLLQITATLAREVAVHPPQLGFSTTAAASQVVTITDSRAKPLTVIRAGASSPHLAVEVGERVAGKGQGITVKLAADAPAGHRDEFILLVTDDPAYAELRVPVRVLKREAGAIKANPDAIAVRFAPGQTEVSTLVRLRSEDGKPIKIATVVSDHPKVLVKWSQETVPVAAVRVIVTEEAAIQAGTCTVRVTLEEPSGKEFVLPVAWSALKK